MSAAAADVPGCASRSLDSSSIFVKVLTSFVKKIIRV
jgi:hypothetical protein